MSAGTEIDLYFVGCGGFARRYHLPALEQDSAVRIRGIADPMPAPQTVEMAARHGAVVVDDIAQLPRGSTLAVAICSSPHALHAEHARASLNAGFHTLVDKPFVLRAEEAVALWQLAEQKQLVNAVAFNRRFDAACLRARAIIANGGIGDVRFVQTVQLGYERAGWFLVPGAALTWRISFRGCSGESRPACAVACAVPVRRVRMPAGSSNFSSMTSSARWPV